MSDFAGRILGRLLPFPGRGESMGSIGQVIQPAIEELLRRRAERAAAADSPPYVPPEAYELPPGVPNPMEPTPPGEPGPPEAPRQPGPPVIFGPGGPYAWPPAPTPRGDGGMRRRMEQEARRYAEEGYDFFEFCSDFDLDPDDCASFEPIFGSFESRTPTALPLLEQPTAMVGPILREVIRRVIRTRPRRIPRPRPRRRIPEPPNWPRRPRRYGEPTPAPRRVRLPRQTPDQPEWTSPYPQIETAPRIPLPPPIEVPRPAPPSPAPSTAPVPPSPGGTPWPVVLPAPRPPSTPPARSPRRARVRVRTGRSQIATPIPLPGVLIGTAALGALLRQPAATPSRFPLQWGAPSPSATPGTSPLPSPSVAPSPVPQPGVQPLTSLNASALPSLRPANCPPCRTRKSNRRKCLARAPVRWAGGPKVGELAGTKCIRFSKQ